MTRILVVDDSELVRRGLVSLITQQSAWEIVGEAIDGADAVDKAKTLQPDVITLDLSIPQLNGLEAARLIREVAPGSRIIFVSLHTGIRFASEAVAVGASAYVCKSDAGQELITAIEAVLRGETFFSSSCSTVTDDGGNGKFQAAAGGDQLSVNVPYPKSAA